MAMVAARAVSRSAAVRSQNFTRGVARGLDQSTRQGSSRTNERGGVSAAPTGPQMNGRFNARSPLGDQ